MVVSILVLALLLALSAFFSSSETILFSLTPASRMRIRERDAAADRFIGKCLDDSAALLSTLLVGNTLVNFAVATLGYRIFAGMFPTVGPVVAVPVMTVVLLVFGEIIPKQVALRKTETLAPAAARLLAFWRAAFTPFNLVLHSVSRIFADQLERERRALSDGELVSVLSAAVERGEFSGDDAKMVEGVLRLSELSASDEMTPRVDMEGYDLDLPEPERMLRVRSARHRYLPVINRSPDVIEGIWDRETGKIEDALFVPESVTLDDLLVTLKRSGKPLAVVLDEYGGTAGIIALADILELIFGPGVYGNPDEEPAIVERGENLWEVDARANLDEVGRVLGVELEAGDADRISGWVAYHAERLPHVGQEIEADGCRATILKRRRRRVVSVLMKVETQPRATDEEILAETDEEVEKAVED
jgi:CBS domain containing-hemolysin-like protein